MACDELIGQCTNAAIRRHVSNHTRISFYIDYGLLFCSKDAYYTLSATPKLDMPLEDSALLEARFSKHDFHLMTNFTSHHTIFDENRTTPYFTCSDTSITYLCCNMFPTPPIHL
ncbi:hypothetical protein AVEN_211716-1 [Araneus ventricosus]|uniref:Uncharacterized protein n=1 Tax=Araneus ventricosus TaxID=182803 RepID=A0A4Y2MAN3_ARAVE|nr:hypothetical protein AVEN_211716-1 [Araneus ventricosus]